MGEHRVIIETDPSVVSNNSHDHEASESSSSSSMAVDGGITEGSIDHNMKSKGVLDGNIEEEKELKIDVKLDDGGGEMVCRICQLSSDQSPERFGDLSGDMKMKESSLIELGCGCKDALGIAHSHCAETWFKLKGNRVCEICGEAARNITGIIQEPMLTEWNNRRLYENDGSYLSNGDGGWWRGQPCCNLLMACLIVAFVLPWFFRVKIV